MEKTKKIISVVIATKNEEDNLAACLTSVAWADEIIIVDQYSNDQTVTIAKEYADHIIFADGGSLGLIEHNKNQGIKKATGEWILIVDADERVSPALKKEILQTISTEEKSRMYNAFTLHFQYYFKGKKLHTYLNNMHNIRLFKNGKGYFKCTSNHEQLIVEGSIGRLEEPLNHHWCASYKDLFKKARRYAKQDAKGMYFAEGNSLTKKKKNNVGCYELFFEPLFYMGYIFIIKRQYQDGLFGFLITLSFGYYLYKTYWQFLFLSLQKSLQKRSEQYKKSCVLCEKSIWKKKISGKIQSNMYTIYTCRYCDLSIIDPFPAITYDQYTVDFYIKNKEMFNVYMKEILDFVKKYKKCGTFLDIGAHIGLLVKQATEAGFKAEGIEFSKEAIAYGKKHFNVKYYNQELHKLALKHNNYDVVTMNHVLEHVDDPNIILKEIGKILKPSGILVIAVPNFGSLSARILRARWPSLKPDEHTYYFTKQSLQMILEKNGFIVKEIVINEPYRAYAWRFRSILRLLLFGPGYWFCDKIGQGRNLIVVAQKPVNIKS